MGQGLEGGDPEDAETDQPEVRDLVQQVAREEEEQDEGYSRCKEPSIIHHSSFIITMNSLNLNMFHRLSYIN